MKKIMITMALVVLILSNVCGHSLMNALADEKNFRSLKNTIPALRFRKAIRSGESQMSMQGAAECPLLTTSLN